MKFMQHQWIHSRQNNVSDFARRKMESHCTSRAICPQISGMNLDSLYSELTLKTKAKLVLVVLDGLGDIATQEQNYLTPLEAATTPNLDALAKDSAQGRMIPVAPGITPGSGPGHLGLFGYDPLEFQVGRGVIEALGLGMELKAGDVAARANFCTLDDKGNRHRPPRRTDRDRNLRRTLRVALRRKSKRSATPKSSSSRQRTSLRRHLSRQGLEGPLTDADPNREGLPIPDRQSARRK